MIGLSRKSDYALVALAQLAEQHGTTLVSARRIAETYALPLPVLMTVLKRLHRAGIVSSVRGSHGGYTLAQVPRQITLAKVIDAIEGPVQLTRCCRENDPDGCMTCQIIPQCPVTNAIRQLNQRITAVLEGVTLDDLIHSRVAVPTTFVGALGSSFSQQE